MKRFMLLVFFAGLFAVLPNAAMGQQLSRAEAQRMVDRSIARERAQQWRHRQLSSVAPQWPSQGFGYDQGLRINEFRTQQFLGHDPGYYTPAPAQFYYW